MTRAKTNDLIRRTQTYAILDAGRIDTVGCNPISLLFDSRIWKIRLQADPDNTGTVEVGNQWRQPYELIAGAELEIPIDHTSKVYVEIGTAGDAVNWWAMGTTTPISYPSGYTKKIVETGPIAYWTQGEQIGAIAYDQINPPAQNGAYTGVTLGQPGIGDGSTSPLYDGANDYTNIYSTTLNTAFNGAEGTAMVWAKVSGAGAWTDGQQRTPLILFVDANNSVFFRKHTGNNEFRISYEAGGVLRRRDIAGLSTIDWMCFAVTWSAAADEVRVYLGGVQQGAVFNGLGVWAGNLSNTQTVIGAGSNGPVTVWSGTVAHCAVWNRALSPAENADLAVL